jgi:hypothetical protein
MANPNFPLYSYCNNLNGYCYQSYGPPKTLSVNYTTVPDCSQCIAYPPPPPDPNQPSVLCYTTEDINTVNITQPCFYASGTNCPPNSKQVKSCNEGYKGCCSFKVDSQNPQNGLQYYCSSRGEEGCPAGASFIIECGGAGPWNNSCLDTGVCCPPDFKVYGGTCPTGGIPLLDCTEGPYIKKGGKSSSSNKKSSSRTNKKSRVTKKVRADATACPSSTYCKWWQCPAVCQGSDSTCVVPGQKYSCANGTCSIDANGKYDNCCDACNPPPSPAPPSPKPVGNNVNCCQNGKCFTAPNACPTGSTQVDTCNKCYQHCCGQQVVDNKMVNVCSPKTAAGCPAGTNFVEDCSQCSGPVQNIFCCHPDLAQCCPYTSSDGSCAYGAVPTLDCLQCPYLSYPK